jgi:hypothetical protein
MCTHDGTATGLLVLSRAYPGMIEPILRCERCETSITHFVTLPYRGTPSLAHDGAVPKSEPENIAETYQIPTALTAGAHRAPRFAAAA